MMRTREDIDEQLNTAAYFWEQSRYPGKSYEEGVTAALKWVVGDCPDAPFEEADVEEAHE